MMCEYCAKEIKEEDREPELASIQQYCELCMKITKFFVHPCMTKGENNSVLIC